MSGSDNLEPLSPSLQKIILRDSGSRRTLYLLSRRSALLGWDLLQVRRLEAGWGWKGAPDLTPDPQQETRPLLTVLDIRLTRRNKLWNLQYVYGRNPFWSSLSEFLPLYHWLELNLIEFTSYKLQLVTDWQSEILTDKQLFLEWLFATKTTWVDLLTD